MAISYLVVVICFFNFVIFTGNESMEAFYVATLLLGVIAIGTFVFNMVAILRKRINRDF
ncbi:MAG: hypothetical protein ABI358_08770 [Ginsengibacter sp.]